MSDGHNGATPAQIEEAFDQIIELYDELASERGTYMQRCREIRERMGNVYEIAAERGIDRVALKAKAKEHQAQQKLLSIRAELEPDDANEFDRLTEILGDFGGTPLGTAALDRVKAAEETLSGLAR